MKLDRGVMRHRQDLSWSQLQRKNDESGHDESGHDECTKNGSSLVTRHNDLPQKELVTRQLAMTSF